MTRKDYAAIAAALAEAREIAGQTQGSVGRIGVAIATQQVAEVLAADNPRFDRARFLAAAGQVI